MRAQRAEAVAEPELSLYTDRVGPGIPIQGPNGATYGHGDYVDTTYWREGGRLYRALGRLDPLPRGTPAEEARKAIIRAKRILAEKEELLRVAREVLPTLETRVAETNAAKVESDRAMAAREGIVKAVKGAENALNAHRLRVKELDEDVAALKGGIARVGA